MNDDHKIPGCDGNWVNIGTLNDPHKQLCTKCRAVRKSKAEDTASERAEEMRSRGVSAGLVFLLIGALVVLVATGVGFAVYLSLR